MGSSLEGREFYRLVFLLGALTATGPFATDMYLASFPELARAFDAPAAQVQLGLSLFFLGLALGQPVYGPVIDSFGRRVPMLVGIGVFTGASVLLALAPNIESFVALRFVQAVGACAGMIIGRAIINDRFGEKDVARVMSYIMLVIGLAPVLAPMTGAYIVAHASWQYIFVALTAIGAACLAGTYFYLPESLPHEARKPFDFANITGNYRRVLTNRRFMVPTLGIGFSFGTLFAFVSGSPFVYMEVFGLSPQAFGWLFALNAFGLIGSSQLNRLLLANFQLRQVLLAASGIASCAAIVLVAFAGSGSLVMVVLPLFVCLAPTPMIAANATAIALQAARRETGSASAVLGVIQFGFGAVVSGLLGLIHYPSVYPMGGIMLVCSLCATAIFFLGVGKPESPARRSSLRD